MILQIDHLQKSFRQGESLVEVLKDVELTLSPGETVAILGQSGSGKSTLLSLLAGLDHPTSGTVRIADQDLKTLSEDALSAFRAKHLGIVFQQFHLMPHLTALENVSLPLELAHQKNARADAQKALEQVGLGHRTEHFPHQMSGGEKQRVAIARALAVQPKLLLADEPSGNLDDDTGSSVMQLFFDLVEKNRMTLILVTHNRELASKCQRQVTLAQGRLVESRR